MSRKKQKHWFVSLTNDIRRVTYHLYLIYFIPLHQMVHNSHWPTWVIGMYNIFFKFAVNSARERNFGWWQRKLTIPGETRSDNGVTVEIASGLNPPGAIKPPFFSLLFTRQTILTINYATHGLWTLILPRRN